MCIVQCMHDNEIMNFKQVIMGEMADNHNMPQKASTVDSRVISGK